MNQIATLDQNQLKHVSTEELKRHLAVSLEFTARHMMYMAGIWRELENRGEDLSELAQGLAAYLPLIAHGKIDAELVVRLAGQKRLLAALSSLPIDAQRSISIAGYIEVVKEIEGELVTIKTPLNAVSSADINKVVAGGRIRTPEEQCTIIENKESPCEKPAFREWILETKRLNDLTLEDLSYITGDSKKTIERALYDSGRDVTWKQAYLIHCAVRSARLIIPRDLSRFYNNEMGRGLRWAKKNSSGNATSTLVGEKVPPKLYGYRGSMRILTDVAKERGLSLTSISRRIKGIEPGADITEIVDKPRTPVGRRSVMPERASEE